MKAVKGDRVKIVKKMNDWSSDYQEGDVFTVESTWYGGINVTSSTGIPLSIDEIEYEIKMCIRDRDKEIKAKGYLFTILAVENNTIQKVRVEKLPDEEKGEEKCQDIQNSQT